MWIKSRVYYYAVAVGEKLVSAFQWDMSGIIINSNTDIGHHTSTLVRTMTTIASDLEGQEEKLKTRTRLSTSTLHSPKSQSSRVLRKISSSTKGGMHRRTMSMHHGPSHADTVYTTALEQKLAKQTKKVQKLKLTGAASDSLRNEEDILRSTEQELAKTVQRMFRHPRTGFSIENFNQIFFRIPERPSSSTNRKMSLRTRLFSVTEDVEGEERRKSGVSSPVLTNQRAKRIGHRRYTSDVTGMRASSPSPTPLLEQGDEEDDTTSSLLTEDKESPQRKADQNGFYLPSIDLEFDMTVNVDHGKIVLRTEER